MDPQETLWNLLESIYQGDREATEEELSNLKDWHDKGGYLPEVREFWTNGGRAFLVKAPR